MDLKNIYGGIHSIIDFPDDSTDEDLSDDDQYVKIVTNGPPDTIPETDESESDPEDIVPLSRLCGTSSRSVRNAKLRWRDGFLEKMETDVQFCGDTTLPMEIMELETPFQFFKYLFTDEMFQHIEQETQRYAYEKRPEKALRVTAKEIEQFVGICLMMSIIQLPATRDYWNPTLGHPKVNSVMSCNYFEEIKRFIHFNEDSKQVPRGQPGYDPVHKLQPFLNQVRERLLTVPKEQYMAVDEQIIPTKSRSSMKQYNPQKQRKWGYKNFVLRGSSGFSYDFELYTGAHVPKIVHDDLPNISTSSNVVVRLARTIPENLNYKLFFENWYTSLPLLVYLTKKGILPIGTIKVNRIPGYKVPLEKDLKKMGKGALVEKLTTVDNIDISITTWYDNRIVNLASTYVGSQPVTEVRRYNKKDKMYESVPCPNAVTTYNKHMGGVDFLDALLGYYRIQIRSKKFYHLIFFHIIDMVTVNAWLLYKRRNNDANAWLPLSDFKVAVAEALTMANKPSASGKCGRPSNILENAIQEKKVRGAIAIMPSQDVRLDKLDHLPVWSSRQRCKVPDCTNRSYVECKKCKVNLCLNEKRNCFLLFHTI